MDADKLQIQRAVWVTVLLAALMSAQLVASRAVRDGFFLSWFEPSALPIMVMVSALLSVAVVLGSAHGLRNVAPARSVPWFFGISALFFLLEWGLAQQYPAATAVALYLHVMSLSALVASGFWSVISERFDPYTAKRYIGRIGGGATLGGVLGGAAAWAGAGRFEVPSMMLVLAVLNVFCAYGVWTLGRGSSNRSRAVKAQESGLKILARTPYLRNLALLVALAAFCQAAYDYVFKARVAEHFSSSAELVSFFALFYMGLNICTFLIQNLFAKRSLEKFGLSFTVASLPGSGAILGAIGLLFPGLASALAMRGGIGAVENSMFRSGYELLYTPVLQHIKRPTKTIFDVGGEMLGALIGGGVAFVLIALVPGLATMLLVLAGIVASVAGIYVTRRIRFGYIAALADSLHADHVDLEAAAQEQQRRAAAGIKSAEKLQAALTADGERAADGSQSAGLLRSKILHRLSRRKALAGAKLDSGAPSKPARRPYSPRELAPIALADIDALTAATVRLRSGSYQQAKSVLQNHNPLPAELVVPVLMLLDHPTISDLAFAALRQSAAAYIGTLLDAVRDERYSMNVRRRLCDVLGQQPSQRCADGLIDLLKERDFELRFRAGASLLRLHRRHKALRVSRRRIFQAASIEARDCHQRWKSRVSLDSRLTSATALDSRQGRRVVQGMTHIFTLLLTVLDQQPTTLAVRALASRSTAHRGTGLEYLENVVPAPLYLELRSLFEDTRLAVGVVRTRSEILAELMLERESSAVDITELRRRVDAMRKAGEAEPGQR